jgi:hypothetical protein
MTISTEAKAALLAATREAASALQEDTAHMAEILEHNAIPRGEIRRISSIMRRLLIDKGGDVGRVAAPRVGRVNFHAPDNSYAYANEKYLRGCFFGSGCGASEDFKFYGGHARAITVKVTVAQTGAVDPSGVPSLPDPHKLIPLKHDGFLSQRVIYFLDKWATRRDVITYVANIASGVHSGAAKESIEKMLAQARNCVSFNVGPGGSLNTAIHVPNTMSPTGGFNYSSNGTDFVLFELICAAHLFVTSPDVRRLCSKIKEELGS